MVCATYFVIISTALVSILISIIILFNTSPCYYITALDGTQSKGEAEGNKRGALPLQNFLVTA